VNFAISTTFPAMADLGLWFAYGFQASRSIDESHESGILAEH